jgi:hypothetical protein
VSGQEFEMQDLRLIGVQEDGQHLLLAGPDGTHFRLPLDEPLRAAARRDRPRLGQLQIEIDGGMRPREVQSLIRAGATAEEVADRAGWTVEKVRRYEGPILAERVHVADQARLVRVRSRGGATGTTVPTLQGRVAQRMRERGVDPESSVWDAWRGIEESLWTVVLTFAAGGRQRQAAWVYDPVLRTVEAADDEARWLSADEPTSMGPLTTTPRVTNVYDVEAEGGVAASTRRAAAAARAGHEEEPLDLMTAMRQRTTVGRRSGRRRAASAEPARRETTPALPIETAPPVATVEAATPVPEVHAETPVETPVQPAVDAAVEPPVESPVEPDTQADSLEHLVVADEVEVPEETAAQEPDEPVLEPAGAETPPLDEPGDEPVDEPVDEVETRDESLFGADAEPDIEPEVVDDDLVIEADAEPDAEPEVVDDLEADAGLEVIETVEEPAPAPVTKKTASRRKQRPSVPSWDDIMFGAKRD